MLPLRGDPNQKLRRQKRWCSPMRCVFIILTVAIIAIVSNVQVFADAPVAEHVVKSPALSDCDVLLSRAAAKIRQLNQSLIRARAQAHRLPAHEEELAIDNHEVIDVDLSHEEPTRVVEDAKRDSTRSNAVRDALKHAWNGYKRYAWGKDELKPLSKQGRDWLGLGLTLIDAMDTLHIAGLKDEFDEGREWIAGSLNFDVAKKDVNVFGEIIYLTCVEYLSTRRIAPHVHALMLLLPCSAKLVPQNLSRKALCTWSGVVAAELHFLMFVSARKHACMPLIPVPSHMWLRHHLCGFVLVFGRISTPFSLPLNPDKLLATHPPRNNDSRTRWFAVMLLPHWRWNVFAEGIRPWRAFASCIPDSQWNSA